MNRSLSLYLDLIRFLAAMLVFFNHAQLPELNGAWLSGLGAFGREAVMIFFVLSGYVIAHVAATKETTGFDFSVSRLARLYSVVLPALLLTIVADRIGLYLSPALYQGGWYIDSHPVPRLLANLLFVNEVWFESVRPFSNGPFWSMGYEASYYLIFGLWTYLAPRHRLWAVLLALAVVGPKVALLFPIWLLGVAVYRLNQRWTAPPALAWLLFVGSFAAFITLNVLRFANYTLDLSVTWFGHHLIMEQLHYSKFFISAYVVGLLVAANFIGVNGVSASIGRVLEPLATPIQFAAGLTFSIYLFHYPLLHMFRAMTASSIVLCCSSLLTIVVLGVYTERRKYLYKRFFSNLLTLSSARLATWRNA